MKMSGIGGQAVLEGIMMKNKEKYAVAVRKPDKEIEVCVKEYKGITYGKKILNLPFIRGIFNFIDSMVLGISTLLYSASFYDEEEETAEDKKGDKIADSMFKDKAEAVIMTITVIVSACIALGLFVVLPSILSDLLKKQFHIISYALVALIEGILRVAIFILYLFLMSKMEDMKRTFRYHGAEHKCINCIEHGMELNTENVLKSSRIHRRCGTSFLFLVMAISILVFILVPVQNPGLKIIVRLLMIPVVAGLSYEVLRYAGRHEGKIINIVSAPGMALQRLTTAEPDKDMVEVAIKAVEAVFDWKAFLEEYNKDSEDVATDNSDKGNSTTDESETVDGN